MAKKSEAAFEQIELFSSAKKPSSLKSDPKPEPKKPFVPVHTMAIEASEIKNNFMYMMRILLNSHQRTLSDKKSQDLFLDSLIHEVKIKRGLIDPEIAVRSCALKSLKK